MNPYPAKKLFPPTPGGTPLSNPVPCPWPPPTPPKSHTCMSPPDRTGTKPADRRLRARGLQMVVFVRSRCRDTPRAAHFPAHRRLAPDPDHRPGPVGERLADEQHRRRVSRGIGQPHPQLPLPRRIPRLRPPGKALRLAASGGDTELRMHQPHECFWRFSGFRNRLDFRSGAAVYASAEKHRKIPLRSPRKTISRRSDRNDRNGARFGALFQALLCLCKG